MGRLAHARCATLKGGLAPRWPVENSVEKPRWRIKSARSRLSAMPSATEGVEMVEDALDFSHDLITRGSPRSSKALSWVCLEIKVVVIILM